MLKLPVFHFWVNIPLMITILQQSLTQGWNKEVSSYCNISGTTQFGGLGCRPNLFHRRSNDDTTDPQSGINEWIISDPDSSTNDIFTKPDIDHTDAENFKSSTKATPGIHAHHSETHASVSKTGESHSSSKSLRSCNLEGSGCRSAIKLNDIYSFLHTVAESYNDTVRLSILGETYGRNPIYAVEIHRGNAFHYSVIVVDFGLHPKEWASAAASLDVIWNLLKEGGALVESIQWFIIPMANPDGYVYATTVDNLWRKNGRPINGSKCSGVDLNRNFDVRWEKSLSKDPCKGEFSGEHPFSEIETTLIRSLIETIDPQNVDAYVSVHTCFQCIRLPYKYTTRELPTLKEVASKMAKAMREIRGKNYAIQYEMDPRPPGVVTDYMYERFRIPLVYHMELGDTPKDYSNRTPKKRHFCNHPPPALQRHLTEECHAGLKALAQHFIETRKPYAYKWQNRSEWVRHRPANDSAKLSAHINHPVSFDFLVTMSAMQLVVT